MRWGFAAGELAAARDLAAALEPLARSFDAWEVTGEGALGDAEGVARAAAVLPSFRLAITYHAAWRGVDLAAPDPAARSRHVARLRAQLGFARDLGAAAVVVHPGERFPGLAEEGALQRSRTSLAELAAAARDLGVELRVENMPRGPAELAQDGAALRALAEPTTGTACWDLGHARTHPGAPGPAQALHLVRELHLHDNAGRHDDHRPLTAASGWAADALRALAREATLVVVEHRTTAECLASRAAAQALLAGRAAVPRRNEERGEKEGGLEAASENDDLFPAPGPWLRDGLGPARKG